MKKIIHTDKAPKALGPYNQAIVDTGSGLVFTAGQIGIDPQTGELVRGGIEAQTHQVFRNLQAVLNAAGISFENVIKVTVFLKNLGDFTSVNEIYSEHFSRDFPARSTVEVARLPKDALIEIEMVAGI